jgi:zinc transporter, ZIP family
MATSVRSRMSLPIAIGFVLLLVAAAVGLFKIFDATVSLRESPPVETLAFERTVFDEGTIELQVRNDGPDEVVVAQLLVNDAYWNFEVTDRELSRLETATISLEYPWEEGLPVVMSVVTATGVTITHEVEAATLTPEADASTFVTYALLGLYIGVIPVVFGLFAFPLLKRMSKPWLGFFLALTVGLLAFLFVDTVAEGLELAGEAAGSLDGVGLFAIGALLAISGLLYLEDFLGRRKSGVAKGTRSRGLVLAYLIAAGIGLHNLGEGLAVGSAIAAGEVALGTFLVIGFALHNTTEGLAIVAPMGGEQGRPKLWHFAGLGAVAGVPTIFGAWIGGFLFAPAWAALMFGLAAGAIAQVIWTIGSSMRGEMSLTRGLPTIGFLTGLIVMYGTGLLIA